MGAQEEVGLPADQQWLLFGWNAQEIKRKEEYDKF